MISLQIVFFVISFLITLMLVPLNIKFSIKYHFVDIPIDRSIHKKPVPLAGGLSFALVITMFELVLAFLFKNIFSKYIFLIFANFLVIFFGIYDDKKKSKPIIKLILEILLIVILYYGGFQINILTNPFTNKEILLGILSFPLTLIWFLILINAINFIDGLDGLAAGIIFFTTLVLMILANLKGFTNLALISAVISGAMLAFLKYNFYPAKIFMGDTGSLFLGLNLAAISIIEIGKFKKYTALTLLIPISTLILPLSDFMVTIFRRIKSGKNIMKADKRHLHHLLLNIGLSQKKIAIISYIITFAFGLMSISLSFFKNNIMFLIIIVLFILIFFAYYFIYKEKR